MTMWLTGSYAEGVLNAARAWQDARKDLLSLDETNSLGEERNDAYCTFLAAELALSEAIDKHRSVDS